MLTYLLAYLRDAEHTRRETSYYAGHYFLSIMRFSNMDWKNLLTDSNIYSRNYNTTRIGEQILK